VTALVAVRKLSSDEGYRFGPMMKALPSDRMRQWVISYLDNGGRDQGKAAAEAGYTGSHQTLAVTGHRLAHDERVQAALHEEAHKRLRAGTILSVSVLTEIISNDTQQTKDRLKAIEMLLNRTGLHAQTEHKVTVEHTVSEEKMVERIMFLSQQLGLDAKKLLGSAGVIVDADFKVVDGSADGLEDVI
jgi:phage terminase small subunit